MSARVLLEVSLRVMGLWYFFAAMESLVTTGSYAWTAMSMLPTNQFSFVASLSTAIVALAQLGIAAVLVRWAPSIAARFYPVEAASAERPPTIGAGDIYQTACFVLGVYMLVQGAVSTAALMVAFTSEHFQDWQLAASGSMALVYTASGLLLIFGARRIGQFIAGIRHDPDSIPQQQFSLKLLLIITGVVAVVLGAIRIISMR